MRAEFGVWGSDQVVTIPKTMATGVIVEDTLTLHHQVTTLPRSCDNTDTWCIMSHVFLIFVRIFNNCMAHISPNS